MFFLYDTWLVIALSSSISCLSVGESFVVFVGSLINFPSFISRVPVESLIM